MSVECYCKYYLNVIMEPSRCSYLVNARTALGDEPHNDRLLAAGHEAEAHCRVPFQGDATWLWCGLIIAVEVRQFVRCRFVQVAGGGGRTSS